jgi:hypothetical protein
VNTPAPTPKTTISLMLKDACGGGAVLWACKGGGGTGASASGVGTCAVRWTGLPQDGQNRSSGLNSCPQLPQYLSGASAILPSLFRLPGHVVGHPLAAHRLASMLLLYLISIGESEYHSNELFLEFLWQEVAELLRNPIRRSSHSGDSPKFGFTGFSEVGWLCALAHIHFLHAVISCNRCVQRGRRVRGRDRYLPSF